MGVLSFLSIVVGGVRARKKKSESETVSSLEAL